MWSHPQTDRECPVQPCQKCRPFSQLLTPAPHQLRLGSGVFSAGAQFSAAGFPFRFFHPRSLGTQTQGGRLLREQDHGADNGPMPREAHTRSQSQLPPNSIMQKQERKGQHRSSTIILQEQGHPDRPSGPRGSHSPGWKCPSRLTCPSAPPPPYTRVLHTSSPHFPEAIQHPQGTGAHSPGVGQPGV